MLGLAKTCAKLKISCFHDLGARLGVAGPHVPPLANLIAPAPSRAHRPEICPGYVAGNSR